MADRFDRQTLLVEEWKEARNSIARFDEHLVSLRKYGFTLATIMIATDAYLSTSVHIVPWAKAGAAIVVMVLIFALFLLDERLKLLRDKVVLERAVEVEGQLGRQRTMLLCRRRQGLGQKWAIKYAGVMTYIFFLAVAGGVGAMSVLTTDLPEYQSLALHRWLPTAIVSGLCAVWCVLTISWDKWASEACRTGIRKGYDRSKDKLRESRTRIAEEYRQVVERTKRLRRK